MRNHLFRDVLYLYLLITICIFTNCTIRAIYLSATDHLKFPVGPVCDWVNGSLELKTKHLVDSLLGVNKQAHSLLILKNDTLRFEWYKKGYSANTAHNVKSAAKSVTSLLTGIAIDKGFLNVDTRLKDIFPGAAVDSIAGKVTVRDLLTMHGGFPYSEYGYFWLVCTSLNPVASILKQRQRIEPGDSSVYSNIGAYLLGLAVAKAANMKLEEFADKFLFSPLGIRYHEWEKDLRGNTVCAGDLFLCQRDFAKIGYLMLKKGAINGDRIVSEEWIKESTLKKNVVKDFPSDLDYGYLWWLDNMHSPGAFFALGSGGQILYISPQDNAVIVVTSALSSDWFVALNVARKVLKTIN
jgi:CubicO group peptidase (beta-lactamase class C family)